MRTTRMKGVRLGAAAAVVALALTACGEGSIDDETKANEEKGGEHERHDGGHGPQAHALASDTSHGAVLLISGGANRCVVRTAARWAAGR